MEETAASLLETQVPGKRRSGYLLRWPSSAAMLSDCNGQLCDLMCLRLARVHLLFSARKLGNKQRGVTGHSKSPVALDGSFSAVLTAVFGER